MQPSAAYRPDGAGRPGGLHYSATLAGETFAADVAAGLSRTPRAVSPRWLYDAVGSVLFDAICRLPWYPITRAETALLDRHAGDIAARLPHVADVIELGPGSGDKLARLMAPMARRSVGLSAHLVDVSAEALDAARRTVSVVPRIRVVAHEAEFEDGLRLATASPRRGGRLVLFLGSNIGNFDPAEATRLIDAIAAALAPGDGLLLGADLVKPEPILQLAYDDPLGVTAAFNRNLLVRMNRELGADFDLGRFRHDARWDLSHARMEMHLVASTAHQVCVPGAGLTVDFAAGESIWTESSYKYEAPQVGRMGEAAGLSVDSQWVDPVNRFALTLFTR